jgi:hypothetical protein
VHVSPIHVHCRRVNPLLLVMPLAEGYGLEAHAKAKTYGFACKGRDQVSMGAESRASDGTF